MRYILDKINAEPVLAFALVQSLIGFVSAFGFDVSAEKNAAILTVTGALLAIVCRGKVSPVPAAIRDDNEARSV